MHRILWLIAGIALALGAQGTAWAQASAFGEDAAVQPDRRAGAESAAPDAELEPAEAILQALDLKGKIAQLMLVTLQGERGPQGQDLTLLRTYTPGGAVVRQMLSPDMAAVYARSLKSIEAETGIPMLIGCDMYELARRERMASSTFIQLPTLLSVAAADDPQATGAWARLLAAHVREMGFNLHLGPSLELAPTLEGAPPTLDTLGNNPDFVADAGETIYQAFLEGGVVSMPMGFPGGGLNRLPKSAAVLMTPAPLMRETDLLPYLRVLDLKPPIMHVGNALVPMLDPLSRPASLSQPVMRDLLRGELRFEGVIVAGPLDADEIITAYDTAEAAALALENGADMLYWRGPGERIMRVVDRLAQMVEAGRISEASINAAVARVLAMKLEYMRGDRLIPKERKLMGLSNRKEIVQAAQLVERRAITLIQNRGHVLPLRKESAVPILVTGSVGTEELFEALNKHIRKGIGQHSILTAKHVGDIEDFEVQRIARRAGPLRTAICVFSDTTRAFGQIRLIQELKAKGASVVVVLLGHPKNAPLLADADAILLAYCDPATAGETLLAMADILIGEGPVRILEASGDLHFKTKEQRSFDVMEIIQSPAGRLPVTVSDAFPAGLAIPYDPSFAVKKVLWDFGNGKRAKKQRASFAYTAPGRYPITLEIRDARKRTTSAVFHAVIQD